MPGPYNPRSSITRKFRFVAQATLNSSMAGSSLLNLIHHAATATTSFPLYQAVRLVKVEMFGAPTSSGVYSEANLRFYGHRSKEQTYEDNGNGTFPAHVSAHPDPDSDSGRWISFLDTATEQQTVLFNVIGATGTTVDVTLEAMFADPLLSSPHTLTCAAATVGALYFNYLDNTALNGATVGNGNLSPIGAVTALLAFG